MKSTVFIAILLTFLMVLLVLSATMVFLWQGQQALLVEIETLEDDLATKESDQVRLGADRASESSALATNQANLATSQSALDRSEQETIDLEQELGAVSAALESALELANTPTPNAADLATPVIEYVSPQNGESFALNAPITIIVLVGQPGGIASIALRINDEPAAIDQPDGQSLVRIEHLHTLTTPGETVISVVATSTLGVASDAILLSVEALPPSPTTPTPTPVVIDTEGVLRLKECLGSLRLLGAIPSQCPLLALSLTRAVA